jgi:hypothetical protein
MRSKVSVGLFIVAVAAAAGTAPRAQTYGEYGYLWLDGSSVGSNAYGWAVVEAYCYETCHQFGVAAQVDIWSPWGSWNSDYDEGFAGIAYAEAPVGLYEGESGWGQVLGQGVVCLWDGGYCWWGDGYQDQKNFWVDGPPPPPTPPPPPPVLRLILDTDWSVDFNNLTDDSPGFIPGSYPNGLSRPPSEVSTGQHNFQVVAVFVDPSNPNVAIPPPPNAQVTFTLEQTSAFKGYAMNAGWGDGRDDDPDYGLFPWGSTASLQSLQVFFQEGLYAQAYLRIWDYGGSTRIADSASNGANAAPLQLPVSGSNGLPAVGWVAQGAVVQTAPLNNSEDNDQASCLAMISGCVATPVRAHEKVRNSRPGSSPCPRPGLSTGSSSVVRRRVAQALGGGRDHTERWREQLPPSAPPSSADCW